MDATALPDPVARISMSTVRLLTPVFGVFAVPLLRLQPMPPSCDASAWSFDTVSSKYQTSVVRFVPVLSASRWIAV